MRKSEILNEGAVQIVKLPQMSFTHFAESNYNAPW